MLRGLYAAAMRSGDQPGSQAQIQIWAPKHFSVVRLLIWTTCVLLLLLPTLLASVLGVEPAVTRTPEGPRLDCAFQKLSATATREGLVLRSSREAAEQCRVLAIAMWREALPGWGATAPNDSGSIPSWDSFGSFEEKFAPFGSVAVSHGLVQFVRRGLIEEYSVSLDGVRQDFVITEPLAGHGDLRLELLVEGARVESAIRHATLTFDKSRRKLAYSRLCVTDATGRELSASLEVLSTNRLVVRLVDTDALYPIRIDPTFSDADWVTLNEGIAGANGPVYSLATDGQGNVYAGGLFTVIGGVAANRIAKWDGTAWSALGSGVAGGVSVTIVRALAVSGTDLYVGGNFTSAGGVMANSIAKWDGRTWSALGDGVTGGKDQYSGVCALLVLNTDLYVGGYFTNAGGVSANRIAKYDGLGWSALGTGMSCILYPYEYAGVFALAANGNTLYAGGRFTSAGQVAAGSIAGWDGQAWFPLGSGMSNYIVYALATIGADVYAGGNFGSAGGVAAKGIAKWDGTGWSALGLGMGTCTSLAASGANLYAGGGFLTSSGGVFYGVEAWDGAIWTPLGSGLGGYISAPMAYALAVAGTNVYAGGYFTAAGGTTANYLAQWNGSTWSALGSGMGGTDPFVYAVAAIGSNVYIGGAFTHAGESEAKYIASWDGSRWAAFGSGMAGGYLTAPPCVYALTASGSDLYVGGRFSIVDGVSARYVAKLKGSTWSPLGAGMDDIVRAIAMDGTNVYAGGYFTRAGGIPAYRIAKWDGVTWSALGTGMNGNVMAVQVIGTNLFAGGYFTNAGGIIANRIARWDGSSWSPLGLGADANVNALAAAGPELYVGGAFTNAGGMVANGIARWDGSAWSSLGSGIAGMAVYTLLSRGADLYAGGSFTSAGGEPANCIAKWDGSAWSALGSGVNGYVYALAADDWGRLIVGGGFLLAGNKVSPYVAKANIEQGVLGGRLAGVTYDPVAGFMCTFCDATVGRPYRIQSSSSLFEHNWTEITNFTYNGPIAIKDGGSVSRTNYFYRAVSP